MTVKVGITTIQNYKKEVCLIMEKTLNATFGAFYLKTDIKIQLSEKGIAAIGDSSVVAKLAELDTKENSLKAYYEAINVRCIDHVCLEDIETGFNLEFIVDDEGLLVPHNPVFEVEGKMNGKTFKFQLFGNFLIGTTRFVEDEGFEFTGFETELQLFETLAKYEVKIAVVGGTRPH